MTEKEPYDFNTYVGDPVIWRGKVCDPIAAKHGFTLTNYGTRWHRNGRYYDIPVFTPPDEVLRLINAQWLEARA